MTITLMNAGVGILGPHRLVVRAQRSGLMGARWPFSQFRAVLGPAAGVAIFFVAGPLSFDALWRASLPAVLYLAIHIVKGESLTPWLLTRRFTLNPVLVNLSLIFWYWMWGVPGAVLATPMLAALKIVCDRIQPLAALGHFIEG